MSKSVWITAQAPDASRSKLTREARTRPKPVDEWIEFTGTKEREGERRETDQQRTMRLTVSSADETKTTASSVQKSESAREQMSRCRAQARRRRTQRWRLVCSAANDGAEASMEETGKPAGGGGGEQAKRARMSEVLEPAGAREPNADWCIRPQTTTTRGDAVDGPGSLLAAG